MSVSVSKYIAIIDSLDQQFLTTLGDSLQVYNFAASLIMPIVFSQILTVLADELLNFNTRWTFRIAQTFGIGRSQRRMARKAVIMNVTLTLQRDDTIDSALWSYRRARERCVLCDRDFIERVVVFHDRVERQR